MRDKNQKVLELHNPRPFNRKMKPLIKGEGFILIFDVGDSMSFYTVTTIREDIVASYNISMRESFVVSYVENFISVLKDANKLQDFNWKQERYARKRERGEHNLTHLMRGNLKEALILSRYRLNALKASAMK